MAEQKILHLTLKKKWFDMIASGEKKEEYREVKPFWIARLVDEFGAPHSCEDFNFEHLGHKMSMRNPVGYDVVEFKNGYRKDAPTMRVRITDIDINVGKVKWGAEWAKPYFIIKLGEILNIQYTKTKLYARSNDSGL